jgi:uncharacterized protein (TIGR03437 family)
MMSRTSALFFLALSGCAAGSSIPASFLNRPLAFEPNRGQAASAVRFVARGNSRDYLLGASGVTVLGASLHFSGAANEPKAIVLDPLGERHNYFHGSVSQTDIPTYRRVRYSRLYPGIDCVFYGDQKGLEVDFEVAPGADTDKIRLRWINTKGVHLDDTGELVIETATGELRQRKPTVYQERDGQRILIAGGYRLTSDGEIRFSLGRYDRKLPLVIDPVLFALDQAQILVSAMATDPAGNIYLTGQASSSILPTTVGAVQPAYGGGTCEGFGTGPGGPFYFACPDAFVIKLDSIGQISYVTYLGGNGYDIGSAIAVDSAGDAYVAGQTSAGVSTPDNFPTTPDAVFPKPSGFGGFVAKLNPAGSQLVYSTYFPVSSGLAIDGQGNAYLAGTVYNPHSATFPITAGAFQTSTTNPVSAGYVAKLNAAGSALVYATYLGGSGAQNIGDMVSSIAVDVSGDAYVTGIAASPDFPTTPGAFQTKIQSPTAIFVSEIATSGASLIYSTFVGPSGTSSGEGLQTSGLAIKVDSQGNAIVLGATLSNTFPVTPGAFQPTGPSAAWTPGGNLNVLSKLNPAGSALVYSTYISGAESLDVDSSGNAYVVGAASSGLPTTAGAFQTCSHGGTTDIFAAEFAPDGTLTGATYLGGSGADAASAVVGLGNGSIDLAGTTSSSDFPGIVDVAAVTNLAFVANVLINNPNHPSGLCIAYTVQNAASFAEGAVAPGEIVTVRGKGLGPQTGVNAKAGAQGFPTELAGVQVLFGGQPAPLLYVRSEQINAMVPWETGSGSLNPGTSVEVKYNGGSVSGSVILNLASPGIFLSNYTTQLASVLNADGTLNSPTNPAKRGTVVTFFGTGGGPTKPPGVDGALWPVKPLANLTLPVSVQINYVDAEVPYSGSAPGLISGVFQINVKVPDLFSPPPTVPIVVTIGGVASAAAFLSVE